MAHLFFQRSTFMKVLFMSLALISSAAFAEVVKVPATNILNAARTVATQTGLFYSIEGKISCFHLNTGWAPASSTCTVTVEGVDVKVKYSSSIVNAVAGFYPPTGPAFEFSGTFTATSMSYEVPPYKVVETASIDLDK